MAKKKKSTNVAAWSAAAGILAAALSIPVAATCARYGMRDPASLAKAVAAAFASPGAFVTAAKYGFSKDTGLMAGCMAMVALAAAAVAASKMLQGGREAADGAYGNDRAYTTRREIAARNVMWDGRTPAKEHGVVVGCIGGREVVAECTQAIVVARTGLGKSRSILFETLDYLTYADSEGIGALENVLITDRSMEIYAQSHAALEKRGYDVKLLDLETGHACRYNPMEAVVEAYRAGDVDRASDLCDEVAGMLLPQQDAGENKVFVDGAAGVLASVVFAVATDPGIPDGKRNLPSVCATIAKGAVNGTGPLKEWIKAHGITSQCAVKAAVFMTAEGKLESGIMSTLFSSLQGLRSASMQRMTSGGDVRVADLMSGRTAVFIRPAADKDGARNALASLFFSQLWALASRRSANRGASRPITILADEFHSMPPFRSFIDSIENGRKCGFRWVVICQNFNSLAKYDHGGERGLNQILGNMSLIVSYGARLADEAKIMSELSGTRTLLAKNTGTSDGPSGSGSNEGLSEREAPVWAVGEIMNRDPRRDGVLVIKSVDGRPDHSGAFEILQRDVTERPTAKNFGTFGSREFEAEVINAEVEKVTARPADDAEVECWAPDFNQKRDDDPAGESLDDLFGLSG